MMLGVSFTRFIPCFRVLIDMIAGRSQRPKEKNFYGVYQLSIFRICPVAWEGRSRKVPYPGLPAYCQIAGLNPILQVMVKEEWLLLKDARQSYSRPVLDRADQRMGLDAINYIAPERTPM